MARLAASGSLSRAAGRVRERAVWLVALALLGASCGPSAPAAAPPPSQARVPAVADATPAPPKRERVQMAYATPSGGFAAPWLAKEAGLFEKYGLDVELTYVASGPTLLQSMLSGETQFGELAAPSSMVAHAEGAPIVWITGAVNRPILVVFARPEIRQFADLRGQNVGVTRIGTLTHIFMKLVLRGQGLDPERDVQILQTGGTPETVAAMQAGGIAAAVGGPPNHLRALAAGMHVLADLADVGIYWPFGGSITTQERIANQPELVRSYLKAYTEAMHLLRTDRERSVAVIAQYTQAEPAIAEVTWEMFRDRYEYPPYPDPRAMQTVVQEELSVNNPRARDVPLESYYDDRLLRELEASGFMREVAAR